MATLAERMARLATLAEWSEEQLKEVVHAPEKGMAEIRGGITIASSDSLASVGDQYPIASQVEQVGEEASSQGDEVLSASLDTSDADEVGGGLREGGELPGLDVSFDVDRGSGEGDSTREDVTSEQELRTVFEELYGEDGEEGEEEDGDEDGYRPNGSESSGEEQEDGDELGREAEGEGEGDSYGSERDEDAGYSEQEAEEGGEVDDEQVSNGQDGRMGQQEGEGALGNGDGKEPNSRGSSSEDRKRDADDAECGFYRNYPSN